MDGWTDWLAGCLYPLRHLLDGIVRLVVFSTFFWLQLPLHYYTTHYTMSLVRTRPDFQRVVTFRNCIRQTDRQQEGGGQMGGWMESLYPVGSLVDFVLLRELYHTM